MRQRVYVCISDNELVDFARICVYFVFFFCIDNQLSTRPTEGVGHTVPCIDLDKLLLPELPLGVIILLPCTPTHG